VSGAAPPEPPTAARPRSEPDGAVLRLRDASLAYGARTLWQGLDLDVRAGEFIAVLGANGTGKSSLLKVVLGQIPLTSGTAQLLGRPIRGGDRRIGYVPQQTLADAGAPLRGRDLIALGVDGHRWGIPLPSRRRRAAVDELVAAVHAEHTASRPLGRLSGGEQQRIRIAQALAGEPRLLLLDEPLLSLDLARQRAISQLVDESRRRRDLGVLFVTHDINPVLDVVDRVLYLAGGRFRIGTPDEVFRSEVLSELYGAPVEVLRSRGRLIVAGAPESPHHAEEASA